MFFRGACLCVFVREPPLVEGGDTYRFLRLVAADVAVCSLHDEEEEEDEDVSSQPSGKAVRNVSWKSSSMEM